VLWYCIHSFTNLGLIVNYLFCKSVSYVYTVLICNPLAKKELNKLCTVPLNGWLDADNSNVGGSGHRDLLYCLGRRVGGLVGAGLDL